MLPTKPMGIQIPKMTAKLLTSGVGGGGGGGGGGMTPPLGLRVYKMMGIPAIVALLKIFSKALYCSLTPEEFEGFVAEMFP